MKLSADQQQDLIDRYLREELSEADQQLLTQARQEASFEQEFLLMADLRQASIAQGRQQLRQSLAGWEQELTASKVIRPLWQRSGFWISIAAGVSLLAVLFLWPKKPVSPTGSTLFAENFTAYPDFISDNTRTDGQETSLLTYTMEAYRLGEYQAALQGLDSLQQVNFSPDLALYQGISQLADGNATAAVEPLQAALKGSFRFSAQWYLALAWLKQEQWEPAREQLQQIADQTAHPQQQAAKELLQQLP